MPMTIFLDSYDWFSCFSLQAVEEIVVLLLTFNRRTKNMDMRWLVSTKNYTFNYQPVVYFHSLDTSMCQGIPQPLPLEDAIGQDNMSYLALEQERHQSPAASEKKGQISSILGLL